MFFRNPYLMQLDSKNIQWIQKITEVEPQKILGKFGLIYVIMNDSYQSKDLVTFKTPKSLTFYCHQNISRELFITA